MAFTARTPYWFWSDDSILVELEKKFHQPGKHPQKRHGRRKKVILPEEKLLKVGFLGTPSALFEDALSEGLESIPVDHQNFLRQLLQPSKLTSDIVTKSGLEDINILGVPNASMFLSQHPELETAQGWYDSDTERSHAVEGLSGLTRDFPLRPEQIRTVTRHELGHALDHALGISKGITDSDDPFYSKTLVEFDKARLNDWLDADSFDQDEFGHTFTNVLETFAESYNFLTDKNSKDISADFELVFPKSIAATRKILEDNGLFVP